MPLTEPQRIICASKARFNVEATGRRFGKTHVLRRKSCFVAKEVGKDVAYIAPTYRMAKRIIWKKFKSKLTELRWIADTHESDLVITLRSGSTIRLFGADNCDAMRGIALDHAACDEFSYWKDPQGSWEKVIRPCLSDRLGSADFASSPNGRDFFYEMYQRGLSQEERWKDWASFHFTTAQGGQVSAEELESARNDLDPLTYMQEYEGSFVNFTGRAYYAFSEANQGRLKYDPEDDLMLMFDFNTAPGIMAIGQEQYLPSKHFGTGIIGEVHIPSGSNTLYVCETFLSRWGNHKGRVFGYGDCTGGNKVASALLGSDWEIIDQVMSRAFPGRWFMRVPSHNPLERARVNSVNSRIKSLSSQIKFMVDPSEAPHTVKDFEGTKILEGSNGQIDKTKKGGNSQFSHLTDAIGYYIHYEFSKDNDVRFYEFRV